MRAVGDRGPAHGETVLVVEDTEAVRVLAAEVLEREGYRVLTAASGREALALCESHQGPIDLVLTDAIMPGMSGRQLAERVADLRPRAKLLFMSGYAANTVAERGAVPAGAPFIEKPLRPRVLLANVASALGDA